MLGCESQKVDSEESKAEAAEALETPKIISQIEQAHKREDWYQEELISFDLSLKFGGKQRFKGNIQMTPDGGLVRMEDSSKVMIWDGEQAWIAPDTIEYQRARFDVLTWSYFFAAPYKFSDPGTNINAIEERPLTGKSYPSFKLTFGENVGDSPDDWYVVYQDRESDLLVGMAYIVTYSKSQDKAEEDPHMITYELYQKMASYPIASQWKFWSWNQEGELKKQLGEANISNFKIGDFSTELFAADSTFRIAEK